MKQITYLLRFIGLAALWTICMIMTAPVSAQSGGDYELDWNTIDAGGGTSSGGEYVLKSTISQPDAEMFTGPDYTLSGGFWFASGCVVDLEDMSFFAAQWLNGGDIEANFDWSDNPSPQNFVDLYDFRYLAAYWQSWCPDGWPW